MAGLYDEVKAAMGITGTALDAAMKPYYDSTIDFMLGAGVPQSKVNSSAAVIARGVNDIWNNGSGDFSQAFIKLVSQLAMRK